MRFEWDREKDVANQKKHGGIAFASAALVFDDPGAIYLVDRILGSEQRWHAIGAVSKALLLVVHVYRKENDNGEIIRLISAREANQRERRIHIQKAAE